jgi:hypothetical protein
MSFSYSICRFVWVFALSASFLEDARSWTIIDTGNGPNANSYQLDGNEFSTYVTILVGGGMVSGVNRGNCGPLQFSGSLGLAASFAQHTLTITLRKNGAVTQSHSTTLGPLFIAQDVIFSFDPVDFSPGDWTIDWQFQTQNIQQGTSQSLKLIPPILVTSFGQGEDSLYCNRNSTFLVASYINGQCKYGPAPPSNFIYNNSYYVTATPTTNCALGSFDGKNCRVMNKPSKGFIYANNFYKQYDACTKGTNDSVHCYLGAVPGGSQTFVYQGAQYYTYAGGANKCPLPGTSDDFAHCYVGSTANAFVYQGGLYLNFDTCSTGTNDGANCLLAAAPWGTTAFEYQGGFYVTSTKTCSIGSFDGANCYIGSAPSGTTAYKQGNDWYWTPRYCQ